MSKPDVNPLFPAADCHRIRGNALLLFQEMIRKLDKESNGKPKHVSAGRNAEFAGGCPPRQAVGMDRAHRPKAAAGTLNGNPRITAFDRRAAFQFSGSGILRVRQWLARG